MSHIGCLERSRQFETVLVMCACFIVGSKALLALLACCVVQNMEEGDDTETLLSIDDQVGQHHKPYRFGYSSSY